MKSCCFSLLFFFFLIFKFLIFLRIIIFSLFSRWKTYKSDGKVSSMQRHEKWPKLSRILTKWYKVFWQVPVVNTQTNKWCFIESSPNNLWWERERERSNVEFKSFLFFFFFFLFLFFLFFFCCKGGGVGVGGRWESVFRFLIACASARAKI